MFVQGGLQLMGGIFVALIYGGIGTFMVTSRRNDEQMMGGVFIVLAVLLA